MENIQRISYQGSEKTRLDKVLVANILDYSRTYLQERIQFAHVKVNGIVTSKSSHIVKYGDEIEVFFPEEPSLELVPQKVNFEVIFEHEDFIIINKPAGLLVHRASSSSDEKTLSDGLVYSFKELGSFEDKERPGIVHRLDKLTSGLMVIARNIKSKAKISQMFKDRKIEKTYLAIVEGHPPREGSIDFPIGRDRIHRHKMSHKGMESRAALSHYKVLAYYDATSLVAVRIVTGRTHQIRVHFAAIGHSLVGDVVYGKSSKLIDRQSLHSWNLSFEYGNKLHKFSCPMPEDLKNLILKIKTQKHN